MSVTDLQVLGRAARAASVAMAQADSEQKNAALVALADLLHRDQGSVLEANRLDLAAARSSGMAEAMLDRLSLEGRLEGIASDVLVVVKLSDPVGEVISDAILPNGLKVLKQRTPLGVLGVIYEARPNVTIDVAALAIKSGNCAILRGGKEALHTNRALVGLVEKALARAGLPAQAIQFVDDPSRELVLQLLHLHTCVDLIIPRGGSGLHQFCRENSTIPVITGGIGICHLFVDASAVAQEVVPVIDNAKTQRPTVCNALDTLLVHEAVAKELLPLLVRQLGDKGVAFCVDAEAMDLFKRSIPEGFSHFRVAVEGDWDTEWLGLTLGVRIVPSLDEAIAHIRKYSSGHSDGILTRTVDHAKRFVREIDSAAVYVNASTRFTDGGQLGLGAEVAISTQKLHARGPMGLRELTSYKWVIWGNNHVRG